MLFLWKLIRVGLKIHASSAYQAFMSMASQNNKNSSNLTIAAVMLLS